LKSTGQPIYFRPSEISVVGDLCEY
jgi:hypothetical protein